MLLVLPGMTTLDYFTVYIGAFKSNIMSHHAFGATRDDNPGHFCLVVVDFTLMFFISPLDLPVVLSWIFWPVDGEIGVLRDLEKSNIYFLSSSFCLFIFIFIQDSGEVCRNIFIVMFVFITVFHLIFFLVWWVDQEDLCHLEVTFSCFSCYV